MFNFSFVVAEQLSEMCRMLEKWPPEQIDAAKAKDRKKKLKDNMFVIKYLHCLLKLCTY